MINYKKSFKSFLQYVKKFQTIILVGHQSPDFDCFGSVLGLTTYLKEKFKDKTIYAVGEEQTMFSSVLFENVDKVEDSVFEREYLAICLDLANIDRVGDVRIKNAKNIIKIDHHPIVESYGTLLNIVDTNVSSCAELITSLILSVDKKITNKKLSRLLYTGIVGDSGRFLYKSTTASTLEVSAALLANIDDISEQIYLPMYEKTLDDLNLTKYIYNIFKVSSKGVGYFVLKDEELTALGIDINKAKSNVNLLSNIKEINIWLSITEDKEKNLFGVSIRSKKVPINKVAQNYSGGGHPFAAGCKIDSLDDLDKLINDLEVLL